MPLPAKNNAYSFVLNALLIHNMGMADTLTWNGPSWSISNEFFVNIFFFAMPFMRSTRVIFCCFFIGLLALHRVNPFLGAHAKEFLGITTIGLLRCFVGFSGGILASKAYRFVKDQHYDHAITTWTLFELFFGSLLLLFYSFKPTYCNILYIPLSVISVFIFSFDKGYISLAVKKSNLFKLGFYSYSIYLLHIPYLKLITFSRTDAIFGRWYVVLAVLTALSFIVYKYIEKPLAKKFRNSFSLQKSPLFILLYSPHA